MRKKNKLTDEITGLSSFIKFTMHFRKIRMYWTVITTSRIDNYKNYIIDNDDFL